MTMEERQHVIALFSAGGIATTTDLTRLNYTEVIARFMRVYQLINQPTEKQNADDR